MISIQDSQSNYLAKVVKLGKPFPHPNADKLEGFNISGNTVWYSKDMLKENDIVIFFPIECQINPKILSRLNLFADKTLNSDINKTGYFNKQGRVKAISLRGQPSEGFILQQEELFFQPDINKQEWIDQQFDTYCNEWVCKKYVPIESRNSGTNPNRGRKVNLKDIIVNDIFKLHYNTPKLSDNLHQLFPTTEVVFTYKLHGTSAVYARLLTYVQLPWWKKLLRLFGKKYPKYEYKNIYSSRNIIKYVEDKYRSEKQGFDNSDIWHKVYKKHIEKSIPKDITLYGEIVGYEGQTKLIQKGYDYGCLPGEFNFYVYRITRVNPDGSIQEFDWKFIKAFCDVHGFNHVPQLHWTSAQDYCPINENESVEEWRLRFIKTLKEDKNMYMEKNCFMCRNKVPAEGVVLIFQNDNSQTVFKQKCFKFLKQESDQLDSEGIDLETSQTI